MASVILKEDHVLKPVPTTGTHSCPTWEYPSELWSRDLRRTSLPCGFVLTTNVNTAASNWTELCLLARLDHAQTMSGE